LKLIIKFAYIEQTDCRERRKKKKWPWIYWCLRSI